MKVTDLRRKLWAALATAGMLGPAAAYAANLNQNLVINGDFEHVDLATVGAYNGPKILDWVGTARSPFAYSHDGSSSNFGVVPNYADGAAPPPVAPATSNHWYFTSNTTAAAGGIYINAPGQVYQDVDVSTGDSAAAIAIGLASFKVSANMSSYLNDSDLGHVHLDFRNSVGASLGTAILDDNDPGSSNVWDATPATGTIDPVMLTGGIPAGTTLVRVSIYGTRSAGGPGPDGYIDNVDFRLVNAPVLVAAVNRTTGNISIRNLSGAAVPISGYSITSAFEGLAPANWTSVSDIYDSGNAGAIDPAHTWSELTAAGTHTDLSEADLQSGVGGSVPNSANLNLGNGAWIQTPHKDLVLQYIWGGLVVNGIVAYLGGVNNLPYATGDFDLNGVINSADWVILRTHQLENVSSKSLAEAYRLGDLNGDKLNNHADFVAFKSLYDAANGTGAFVAMVAATGVPEPSTAILVLAASSVMLPMVRRRAQS